MKRLLLGVGGLLVLLLIGVVAFAPKAVVPPDEIARRCAAARPAWASYHEDVKGMIGATPTATWVGEVVGVRTTAKGIEAVFSVLPPWSDYDFAMPVLLRAPSGDVFGSHTARKENGRRVYVFPETGAAAQSLLPWVELQYPHATRRIALDGAGAWTKPAAP